MASKRAILLFILFLGILNLNLSAQVQQLNRDSLIAIQNRADSLATLAPPTVPADTIPVKQDSMQVNVNGIETTIKYFAQDSIITKILTNQTYLYGDARIEYGRINLAAEQIIIDRSTNELIAKGVQDSTGRWVGRPIFIDGGDKFETEEIRYNFVSQRARIKGVATSQPDGQLKGEVVKRNPDQSAYIQNGKFIPCLDDPNATTYIKSKKIKIIPGKSVITGPFLLYVGDIPTPLGLPFGFFPDTREVTSGILFPKYGDERRRGIFLRDGGWYQAWNDYIHTAITGEYYSKGSWGLNLRNVYKKRYKFSGQLDLRFNRNKTPDTDEFPVDSRDFWISWSHRPESRGRNSRFSASVAAGSSTYNQNNLGSTSIINNIRSEFRSNINFNGTIPRSPFSYTFSARHNQNVQTNVVDISLPEFSFNMNRIYPFKGSKADILKRLNLGWRFNASNRITNVVQPGTAGFDIANRATVTDTIPVSFATVPELLDNATNGGRHNVDLSTSFSFLKNLNFTPSFNVQELWYLEELDYEYLADQNAVRIDTMRGFSRATTYGMSLGLSTQLYGIFTPKNPRSRVEGIRHIVTPSISFSYRPDFSDEKFGYYKTVQTDTSSTGEPVFRQLSIYDGFRFGSPTLGESASIGFTINNQVEMKVRSDTSRSKKVPILQNLTVSGNYNFLADSFNLSTINLTARTALFDRKLQINAGATIDPYTYQTVVGESGTSSLQRRNTLAIRNGQGIGRLTSARFSLSTNLNSRANSSAGSSRGAMGGGPQSLNDLQNGFIEDPNQNQYGTFNQEALSAGLNPYFYDPNAYVDIEIPWNLRLSYDYSYRWSTTGSTTRQTLRMSGQLALTPKWDITFNSGFDFTEKEFTTSSLGIIRDLGCWEMRGNWIPFGTFTSYSIDIQIKASALKDLKISRRRSQFDQNSSFGSG